MKRTRYAGDAVKSLQTETFKHSARDSETNSQIRRQKKMTDDKPKDYTLLDRPEVLVYVFHPRPETTFSGDSSNGIDVMIPVGGGEALGGRFHLGERHSPNLLFFHGNGEIALDYSPLGPLFKKNGINFLPVDYRGYGRSTGTPGVSSMIGDCDAVLNFAQRWLPDNKYTGPIFVMGRSLGSACALELAASRGNSVRGLVVESGFAHTGPLLSLLGVKMDILGFDEDNGFGNLDKIKKYEGPTLIIHAENDRIIPFSDGQALFDASPSRNKTLLIIPGADHNDIFLHGFHDYMNAVKKLIFEAA